MTNHFTFLLSISTRAAASRKGGKGGKHGWPGGHHKPVKKHKKVARCERNIDLLTGQVNNALAAAAAAEKLCTAEASTTAAAPAATLLVCPPAFPRPADMNITDFRAAIEACLTVVDGKPTLSVATASTAAAAPAAAALVCPIIVSLPVGMSNTDFRAAIDACLAVDPVYGRCCDTSLNRYSSLSSWSTGVITDMSNAFRGAAAFNSDLSG
jgi:hypothetical protein